MLLNERRSDFQSLFGSFDVTVVHDHPHHFLSPRRPFTLTKLNSVSESCFNFITAFGESYDPDVVAPHWEIAEDIGRICEFLSQNEAARITTN